MPGRAKFLASVAILSALVFPAFAQADTTQAKGWPQAQTGRAADPAIHFGQLPNGLRYAILHNATPPGQMSLRLYVGSGSLAETDKQQGLAHFLEHMAFRGSAKIADGDLIKILARYGLSFGADTNAATTMESTVYQFDFPKSGTDDIDTGLMLFREIASNLTLSKTSMDAERGVILSEERLRDTPAYRHTKAQVGFLLPGQLAPQRWPIGQVQTIKTATPDDLRSYYDANYRPDNAVIVATGDFDPAVMEAKIKAQFSDWKARGAITRPVTGDVRPRGEDVRLFTESSAPQNMAITWIRPYDTTPDTDAREDRDDIRAIAEMILNHRLEDIAQKPDAPFVAAGMDRTNILKSANVTNLVVNAPADHWQSAMRAVVNEQQRIVRFGVTKAELDRVLAELHAIYANAQASAATRKTPSLAADIVKNINDNDVTRSPDQDMAEVNAISAKVDVAAVNATLKDMFTGFGPLLFLSTPQAPAGGELAIKSAFDTALQDKVSETTAKADATWSYQNFGAPGRVVDRKEIADLGLTIVRFANGTTLTVKPTSFTKDQVLTAVGFGTGRLGLSPQLSRAYWLVPALVAGGTGKLTITDLQRMLEARASAVKLEMQDKAFDLVGHTQPANLDFDLQLAAAYLTDPGFRPEAVERFKTAFTAALPQVNATATGVLQREEDIALHDGDRRWMTIPSAADVAAAKPDDLKALLAPELRKTAPSVVVVGDITVDQAIASVAKTLGALPEVAAAKETATPGAHFPNPEKSPLVFTHEGRADQAFALTAWPTSDFYSSPTDARALAVVSQIIEQRLIDKLREGDGATYSPMAGADLSQTVPGYGYVAAGVEIPPAKIALFQQRLTAIVADLRDKPVSADELDRAKAPMVQSRMRDLLQNGYWLGSLTHAPLEPRAFDAIRTRVTGVQAVTAADVQRVAKKYLEKNVNLIIQPASGAPASH